jgi:hypothetical protein
MIAQFRNIGRTALALAACSVVGTSLAHAQATRTWVSGVGDDANPCSRTAPCKTFAGAISKTATGGEISALDPAGFGAVTITKSIVNAPATSVVTLRNLSINGFGTGTNGVRHLGGASLTIEKCDISGFTLSAIDIEPAASSKVVIRDSSLRTATTGVQVSEPSGRVDVELQNVLIKSVVNGVETFGGFTSIANSTLTQNSGTAILGQGGEISVERSMVTGNNTGATANGTSTVRISNNGFYRNLTAFGCGGGTLASAGDNRSGGNTGGGGGCSPNGTVTVQ